MARIPACSMECLDQINRNGGDMKPLNVDETKAIAEVTAAMMDDVRAFDFANAPDSDIAEFLGYAYMEICEKVRERYEDVPF